MTDTPSNCHTPGSRAIKIIKSQNTALAEFKCPLTKASDRRKPKPKILTEQSYIEKMSKIIQRDFFPDLERLRAQNDYLDAESRRDFTQMAEIRTRFSNQYSGTSNNTNRCNNAMSPVTFETPLSTSNDGATSQSDTLFSTSNRNKRLQRSGYGSGIISQVSLDCFLQRFTSEDNQSFQKIIETDEVKLRQNYAVLYNHEQLTAEHLQRALMLPSIEKQFEKPDPLRKIDTWKYTNMNSIMYVPNGVELTEQERVQLAERKKSIHHNATRLPKVLQLSETQTRSKTVPASVNYHVNVNAIEEQINATPRIGGLDLLGSPSPRPGEAFSPIMTWGEIDGTPFCLDCGDTPLRSTTRPSFRINANSRRENIAIALAEKVSEKVRHQKQHALYTARRNTGSPFVRSNMERLASMSPAARRLASGKPSLRNHTPLLTPSTLKSTIVKNTPKIVRTKSGKQTPIEDVNSIASPIDTGSTLTDDLLKIPTNRRSAADFF